MTTPIKFKYFKEECIRTINCHRLKTNVVITVASILYEEDNKLYLEYGAAFKSPKDIFDKKIGRQYATARLNQKEEYYGKLELSKNFCNKTVLNYYINYLILMHLNTLKEVPYKKELFYLTQSHMFDYEFI